MTAPDRIVALVDVKACGALHDHVLDVDVPGVRKLVGLNWASRMLKRTSLAVRGTAAIVPSTERAKVRSDLSW